MFSTGRFRHALALGLLLLYGTSALAQTASGDAALYRIFLNDGSTLLSYGEFARVADRVVVSLPLDVAPPATSQDSTAPPLHLLSIPADTVDWEKTDAYADSVRAARYAATRGPDDFALLNEAVSRALGDIALVPDAGRRVAMAAEARQNVMKWAAEHFGYRAERVAELASLFDTVISEARAQGGAVNVDLSLVANMAAPPAVPLLPPPSFDDHVDQALRAASLSPDASERVSLLRAIEKVLTDGGAIRPGVPPPVYLRVRSALAAEERANRAYEGLTRDLVQSAERYARAADVGGVERVIRRALSEDDRLGQRRPQEMAALLATLDTKLDAARRLRLARDNWAMRIDAIRAYRAAVAQPLALLRLSRESLDQIKRLAGPSHTRLEQLARRMAAASRGIETLTVPAEGAGIHALLKSAVQFATRAGESRLRAIATREMLPAHEASSAAAGALMFLERATEELATLASLPMAGPR